MTKWQKRVGAGVTTAVAIFGLNLWWGHFTVTGEDHTSLTEAQKTQDRLVGLTEALGQRAEDEDAKLERDAELCGAKIIQDPIICREAQMYMNRNR